MVSRVMASTGNRHHLLQLNHRNLLTVKVACQEKNRQETEDLLRVVADPASSPASLDSPVNLDSLVSLVKDLNPVKEDKVGKEARNPKNLKNLKNPKLATRDLRSLKSATKSP